MKFFFSLLALATSTMLFSQVGIGTTNPNPNSILDISSTTKGVLLPRLTKVQMNLMDPSVEGLMIYCTDCEKKGIQVSNGISFVEISAFSTTPTYNNDGFIIDSQTFNNLFPYRADISESSETGVRTNDFYSYTSFRTALDDLKKIKLEIYRQVQNVSDATTNGVLNPGYSLDQVSGYYYSNYLSKTVRKKEGDADVFRLSSTDWNESWNSSKTIFLEKTIDYGEFLNNANETDNKKELAAFLAHISHETGTDTTNDNGGLNGGLFYKSEVACSPGGTYANTSNCDYKTYENGNDVNFPPVTGKQYYGRGPVQTSWNYNYGILSWVLYGDVNVLLSDPDKVIENGVNAFSAAIHFWMYPFDKPSCHQVINTNRGFAQTINVINGGLECGYSNNNSTVDAKVSRRINFYRTYGTAILYTDTETDTELKCFDLTSY